MADTQLQIDPTPGDPDLFDLYVTMVHILIMQVLKETDE